MKQVDDKVYELDETAEPCEHEFDVNEGYTCLHCGEQGDVGELIDAAEYRYDPER